MAEVSLLRKVVNIKTVSKLNLINLFSQVNERIQCLKKNWLPKTNLRGSFLKQKILPDFYAVITGLTIFFLFLDFLSFLLSCLCVLPSAAQVLPGRRM